MYEHQTHKLHSDLLIKISKYIIHKLGYVWFVGGRVSKSI